MVTKIKPSVTESLFWRHLSFISCFFSQFWKWYEFCIDKITFLKSLPKLFSDGAVFLNHSDIDKKKKVYYLRNCCLVFITLYAIFVGEFLSHLYLRLVPRKLRSQTILILKQRQKLGVPISKGQNILGSTLTQRMRIFFSCQQSRRKKNLSPSPSSSLRQSKVQKQANDKPFEL